MYEKPNKNFANFKGFCKEKNDIKNNICNLSVKNFIPKGSILKNTESIIGIVVYSGIDTKIMLN
jgi:phospholipid-translocating ATPase